MTGVKNKRAFIDFRDEINEKIQENRKSPEKENLEFAVIVFDINNST